ncbi:hypothetical protein AB3S75_042818 [Citrus x aurantiifolia]
MGQRFKNDVQFRTALEVNAIRDGFKLCIIHNTSTGVSCECSNLHCDWKITAVKENRNNVFIICDITPMHTCNQRSVKLQGEQSGLQLSSCIYGSKVNTQKLTNYGMKLRQPMGLNAPYGSWKLLTKWRDFGSEQIMQMDMHSCYNTNKRWRL